MSRAPHPRESANFLSVIFFAWTSKIFIQNVKEAITTSTLWKPYSKHSSNVVGKKLERIWDEEVLKCSKKEKHPSLVLVIFKTFWFDLLILAIVHLTYHLGDVFMRPYLLRYILNYFSPDSKVTPNEFYITATGMILYFIGLRLLLTHYNFGAYTLGIQIKTACIALVYQKSLRLSQGTLRQLSTGHIVNLVSNDASRFDNSVMTGNFLWSTPIMATIVCYQVYNEIGNAALPGLSVIVTVSVLQVVGAKFTSYFRQRIAEKSGERIRLTEELITGMHVIKMHAWEKPYYNLLHESRKLEMKEIFKGNLLRGFFMGFNLFTRRAAICFTFILYVVLGQRLSPSLVYVITAYYSIVSAILTSTFVRGIQEIAEARVAIKRLEEFYMITELKQIQYIKPSQENGMNNNILAVNGTYEKAEPINYKSAITITDVIALWNHNSSSPSLSDISMEVKRGYLAALVGPVASGKTSLLNLMLGEMAVIKGDVSINGTISYASQEPWIISGTVRENILLGLPFNQERYKKVIRACSLDRDIEMFEYGDQEMVGERGDALSGGQKARLNLARAVYKEADIYLLDDPISAVDPHIAKNIVEECFQEFLMNKTVVVATHQLQFLRQFDLIVLLKNGLIEDQGTFEDLVEAGHDYLQKDEEIVQNVKEERMANMGFRWRSLQSISSCDDSISIVSLLSEPDEIKNEDSEYVFKGSPYVEYLKIGGSLFFPFLFFFFFISAQTLANSADFFLNQWITWQETASNTPYNETSVNIYDESDDGYYISIYAAIIFCLFISAFSRGFTFFVNAQICSKKLHIALARSVFFTDISFFNNNPIGAILNRFSRDLGSTDEVLPKAFLETCQVSGQLVGTMVLTAYVNYFLLIPFTALAIISYFLRNFFMKTTLNLKRLEGACRSPILSHLTSTLSGLPTIRAHGSVSTAYQDFNSIQDVHVSAVYSFQASTQGYTFILDSLACLYLGIVIFSFVVFGEEDVHGADVGLAITQTVNVTGMLQWGLRAASETTSLMTSVERILAFVGLKPEETPEDNKIQPPPMWPSDGQIDFRNVELYYKEDSPVLRRVSFRINPREKIGIVGRSGAGKSSITQALFRFAKIEGDIFIDGINTKDIPLHTLRSKIAIIPQTPVLFSGDLRKNLDPYSTFPDYFLLKTLDELEVLDFVSEYGLDTKIRDGGLNLSIGQRQLICLARAILCNSSIIILDEATANVDPNTDALIQRIIWKKFAECTVLTIAHRLNTIMDCDRVMVMDGGRLVEFDHPHLLLQKKRGYFCSLVKETGKDMAPDLILQAQQSYWRKHQEPLQD